MSKNGTFTIELKSEYAVSEFRSKCENPRFVAKWLEKHNRWRRGYVDEMPLDPKALGIVIESAVEHLNLYANDQEKCS